MNKLVYFSIITGEIYEVPDYMKDVLDHYQLQLSAVPKDNCRKCYGRFYTSYDPKLKVYNLCPRCAKKYLMQTDEINIETPITTDNIVFRD